MTTRSDLIHDLVDIADEITAHKDDPFKVRLVRGKDHYTKLMRMVDQAKADNVVYPLFRATLKNLYVVCFEQEETHTESILLAKGLPA